MRRIVQIATSSCYDSETGQEEFRIVALDADGMLWWADRLTDAGRKDSIWMRVPRLPDRETP